MGGIPSSITRSPRRQRNTKISRNSTWPAKAQNLPKFPEMFVALGCLGTTHILNRISRNSGSGQAGGPICCVVLERNGWPAACAQRRFHQQPVELQRVREPPAALEAPQRRHEAPVLIVLQDLGMKQRRCWPPHVRTLHTQRGGVPPEACCRGGGYRPYCAQPVPVRLGSNLALPLFLSGKYARAA